MTTQLTNDQLNEVNTNTNDSIWKNIYKIGAFSALATVLIALIQGPIFILYPMPATVLGHFEQFRSSKLLGIIDLDLMLMLAEACSVPVFLAIYAALRRANPALITIALGLSLSGIAFYFIVNPTLGMLYLSDQYWAATAEAQKAAFLAAGEALWANYNGTAFGLFFTLGGLADLLFSAVMLKSGIFGKATAMIGLVVGVLLLVPPLPTLGAFPTLLSYVVILPSIAWNVLIARRLFQLARSV